MFKQIKTWFMATRPASLWITGMPVMLGSAMALGDGVSHVPSALAALFGAFLIHIGCNLTNDYWDLKRGSDQIGAIDPMRGIPVGYITPSKMKIACILVFTMALIPCAYLISRGGMFIAVIAILSILSAIFYTAGKKSLAYLGWGDLFAFLFFGPVAVSGTYWVQSQEMNWAVALAGIAPGLFAVAVLTINNIRDLDKDRRVNKQTLSVRFGKRFSIEEYLVCIVGIALTPVLLYAITQDHIKTLAATLIAFIAIPAMVTVSTTQQEMAFNHAIGATIHLLIIYSLLFSLGWIF